MIGKYYQEGNVIDFLNETDSDIELNEVVAIGTRCGVAGSPILKGEIGAVYMTGVFVFATSASFTAGADVYFEGGQLSTSGTHILGYAIEDSADGFVKVKLTN